MFQRYFDVQSDDLPSTGLLAPTLEWSEISTSVTVLPTFLGSVPISFQALLPTGTNRRGGAGGLLGDEYGHVVEDSGSGTAQLSIYYPGEALPGDPTIQLGNIATIEQIAIDVEKA